uniref:von Willebrand factor type A domain/Ssl1-like/TFIIH C1-like domain containing protein, putative n=1 Tax=Theileria annulata TaxID=5874 RepID=A0A3B0MTT7_THEAN
MKKYILEELLTEYEQNNEINNNNEDEAYQQYSWELDVDKSWEQLIEKDGILQFIKPQTKIYQEFDIDYNTNLKQHNVDIIYKRGIIRFVMVLWSIMILFDMSEQMHEMDFKPDRLYCAFNSLKEFMNVLYGSGPITQVGIIVMRNKICNVITQFGTNPDEQMELLSNILKDGPEGSSSLQNGLEMCLKIMCELPYYMTREILIIFGSNKTLDPGNILITLDKLKQNFITVNCISLSPELYILKGCGIFMVSPPDISRAFHHLIPPKSFHKIERNINCSGCNLNIEIGYQCQNCQGIFCEYCDKYIHQDLHQCPICLFQH